MLETVQRQQANRSGIGCPGRQPQVEPKTYADDIVGSSNKGPGRAEYSDEEGGLVLVDSALYASIFDEIARKIALSTVICWTLA